MRILLVNPPVYDFTAFDFWLKPYGLLSVAGSLRGSVEMSLFDFMDCRTRTDSFGRGPFLNTRIQKPAPLADIPRHYYRFGRPRDQFRQFLSSAAQFDIVFIQTMMTWWYPGLAEVISDVRDILPASRIILGGIYATLCPAHAQSLGPDLVIKGNDLSPLAALGMAPDSGKPAFWEGYNAIDTGVLKLTDGCPFRCTYCSVPQTHQGFSPRSAPKCLSELESMLSLGASNIAFYDDALLYKADEILIPFLRECSTRGLKTNFHTPNALHARYITPELATLMVTSGFQTFYLGYESSSTRVQNSTGGKVEDAHLASAARNLLSARAERQNITAYVLAGHPASPPADIEDSMRFVHSLGIRITLSDFTPIPGTPDAEQASRLVDLAEPLNHNKTAWPIRFIGNDRMNRLKDLCRSLNGQL
jgi:pyruvate-formate lyase-activating enzyme